MANKKETIQTIKDRIQQCKDRDHLLEIIRYDSEDDYGDGCPPLDVIHCDTCGDELAITLHDPNDLVKALRYFGYNYYPIVTVKEFEELVQVV